MDVGTIWKMKRALGLIAAAYLCLGLITPVSAQSDTGAVGKPLTLDQYFKHKAQTAKKTASLHKGKLAKAVTRPALKVHDDGAATATMPAALPDSIANANARLTDGDIDQKTPVKAVAASGGDASSPLIEIVSGVQIASADQLNDIDRAAMDDAPAPRIASLTQSAAEPAALMPQLPLQAIMSVSSPEEASRRAALMGKIMVAFGLMLMASSAIRLMFA